MALHTAPPDWDTINKLTERIIGAGIEVHRLLGPGLTEPIYDRALCIEFDERRISYVRQLPVPAHYKGRVLGRYRIDFIVEDLVVVEIKSCERMLPLFEAQLLTYLRVTGKRAGLLINFNSKLLTEGIKRLVL